MVGTALVGLTLALAPAATAASPNALCSTTLQEGSSGSCVTALQQRLNQLGATLTVDGSFGPATKNAVLAFQGRSSIGFDGVVGPTTQSHLNSPGSVNLDRVSTTTINNYINTEFGSNATTARKIAVCESSDNEIALNYNTNSTYDIGVFQDNTVHEGSNPTGYIHNMLYYQTNIQEAHALFVAAGGFSPWNSSKSCWG
ncbi:MAG: peptidoglycan-binding protein [Actinomycetota bacterium]|nr:peptidoglycan-binding protein [Actinomycetota bacterium]